MTPTGDQQAICFRFTALMPKHKHQIQLQAGFANPGLGTVLALLVIGQAMVQTGALDSLGAYIHRLSGGNAFRTVGLILLTSVVVSAFLNNTPVVVIFIPIIAALAERLGRASSSMLIPLSYASILGGMMTLIGTWTLTASDHSRASRSSK